VPKPSRLPIALTIAGSDSGGGAGIQADLKTFAALGVHGACAITCLTAQNPRRVLGIHACPPAMLRKQIDAVFSELRPAARVVANTVRRARNIPIVVDPVMISTSGARLLQPAAIAVLLNNILPFATLVTPNLHEAAALLYHPVESLDDVRAAACEIHRRYGCAALVKGGHLKGASTATDIFFDGRKELRLTAPFIAGVKTHGTGCTLSAAITAFLARGFSLRESVTRAKKHVTLAIARSQIAGRHRVLNNFAAK
jgi:hydroxymethylpyrimidine/phosphomethylpyrimidine kinase